MHFCSCSLWKKPLCKCSMVGLFLRISQHVMGLMIPAQGCFNLAISPLSSPILSQLRFVVSNIFTNSWASFCRGWCKKQCEKLPAFPLTVHSTHERRLNVFGFAYWRSKVIWNIHILEGKKFSCRMIRIANIWHLVFGLNYYIIHFKKKPTVEHMEMSVSTLFNAFFQKW